MSGIEDLYEQLIVPLGHSAKEWNDEIVTVYEATRDRLIAELHVIGLILGDGAIDWHKLVQC